MIEVIQTAKDVTAPSETSKVEPRAGVNKQVSEPSKIESKPGIENREQPVLLCVGASPCWVRRLCGRWDSVCRTLVRLEQGIEASGAPTDVQSLVTEDGRRRLAGSSVTSPTDRRGLGGVDQDKNTKRAKTSSRRRG